MICLPLLRLLGGTLMCLGVFQIAGFWRNRKAHINWLRRLAHDACASSPITFPVLSIISVGIFIAIWGPVADIDSLDYHLGVPLDWIRHGGAYPRLDWYHARLIGLGEMINMLGLAMGTDCLGAAFQGSGIIVAIIAVAGLAPKARDVIFASAIVLTCPSILFLAFSQKPQLLPSAATALALSIVMNRFRSLDSSSLFLVTGCLSFAIGCKYSFLLSGALISLLILGAMWKSGIHVRHAVLCLLVTLVVAGPIYARNYAYYGDPVSPMLEALKAKRDPSVVIFSSHLKNFAGDRSLPNLLRLPWHLIATRHPGKILTVLGIGVLSFVLVSWKRFDHRTIMVASIALAGMITAFGQLSARFFLEPYLWIGIAAAGIDWTNLKKAVQALLTLQGIPVAAIAIFAAITFMPGIVTASGRDAFMAAATEGYSAARWIDRSLAQGEVITVESRSVVLLPRPFISIDLTRFQPNTLNANKPTDIRLAENMGNFGLTTLLLAAERQKSIFATLRPYLIPALISAQFVSSSRNPLMRGTPYTLTVYKYNREKAERTAQKVR
jgi:hypothetical protein